VVRLVPPVKASVAGAAAKASVAGAAAKAAVAGAAAKTAVAGAAVVEIVGNVSGGCRCSLCCHRMKWAGA
jgi:hypothetical protein